MEWWKDVKFSLEELGGEAHLSKIYSIVHRRRKTRKDSLGENYKEWIRNSLQQNSRGKGHNIFEPVKLGSGVWKLNRRLLKGR